MIGELVELFKRPVSTMIKGAEERNIKKEAIIAVIIAIIIALVTILTSYIGIIKIVNKTYKSVDDYNDSLYSWDKEVSKSEFKEMKKEYKSELLEDVEFVKTFFKTFAISLGTIALVGGILYVISRTVKSPKDYIEMLAITNRAFIIYLLGFIINTIFSYIYVPVGIVILLTSIVFAIISLCNAFREMLDIEDVNKLVIYSTLILGLIIILLAFIVSNYIDSLFGGLSSLSDFSDMLDI